MSTTDNNVADAQQDPRIHDVVGAEPYRAFYRGRRVMVTGGMGFVGSNLAHQLVALGAQVLIVDSMIPDYGGNPFNVSELEDKVRINIADVRQRSTMNHLVQQVEVIFNLAGQVSHIDSMQDPDTDLDINCRAQLSLLEACRRHNPAVKVVFAGTRQVYGRPDSLPVSEQHLVRPTDVNGINKAAGENYHIVYNNVFGVRACSLRLTNVYGPRQLLKHNRQGFIGWFIRLAIEGRQIPIYGDGSQMRDFVFVDDAADAFLRAGASDRCNGHVFNVGGAEPIAHKALVELLVGIAGSGTYQMVEWPAEKKAIDIGDFYADSSRFLATVGWRPTTTLAQGLTKTIAFYRAHFQHYVPAASQVGAPVTGSTRIPFAELRPGRDRTDIAQAIDRVLARGWFVLGPEVEAFEVEFAAACGAAHAVGVASGTDAIALALRALDIGPGDEVIVPSMTAAFTGLAVASLGARPVIVDVHPGTLTMDVAACAAAVSPRTRAVVPVHLYGQPAENAALRAVAERHGLAVVEDCCQAHLATEAGVPVGTACAAGAFSFYPTKNLGALGDGGAVVTNDAAVAARIRRLRNGGQASRYDHVEPGVNSRLDELQAAVLRVRLQGLAGVTALRRDLAATYRRHLGAGVTPIVERDPGHVYHLFPVRLPERDTLMAFLAERGIETLVHYPVPLSAQQAFTRYDPRPCPVASLAAAELLSLPLNPRMSREDVIRVADTVNEFRERRGSV